MTACSRRRAFGMLAERIKDFRAFLAERITLSDAAKLWVQAELVVGEVERNPLATSGELQAATELRRSINAAIVGLRQGDGSPHISAARVALSYLESAFKSSEVPN
jgi:hypothetical protein